MIRVLLSLFILCALPLPAVAQNKEPIEITADKTLEWHRTELQYVADGNAIVKQGGTTIKGDRITADYRSSAQSDMDIYRLTAIGNVSIDDQGNVATGEKLVYEIDTGIATMTGSALTMTSPEQTVTATEKFEYTVNQGMIKAIGNAKVVRGTDTLHSDIITAFLVDDAEGNNSLDRIEGVGNVKIVTPTEMLTGNRGIYNAKSNTAIVTGSVKITRDQNVLTGERAEIDLTTSISRLFGSTLENGQTGGRVRGVFYPGDSKKAAPQAAVKAQPETLVETPLETSSESPAPTPVPVATPAEAPAPAPVIATPQETAPAIIPDRKPARVIPAPPVQAQAKPKPTAPVIRELTPEMDARPMPTENRPAYSPVLAPESVSTAPEEETTIERPTTAFDDLAP